MKRVLDFYEKLLTLSKAWGGGAHLDSLATELADQLWHGIHELGTLNHWIIAYFFIFARKAFYDTRNLVFFVMPAKAGMTDTGVHNNH